MKKLKKLIAVGGLCALLSGCMPLNSATPSYIKQVTSYKAGSDGLVIYIILADSSGAMTTASGALDLTISETKNEYSNPGGFTERKSRLFSASLSVQRSTFQKAKVGLGAFEHEVILLSLGRIAYSSFSAAPKEMTGKILVEFRTEDGHLLKGESTVFF